MVYTMHDSSQHNPTMNAHSTDAVCVVGVRRGDIESIGEGTKTTPAASAKIQIVAPGNRQRDVPHDGFVHNDGVQPPGERAEVRNALRRIRSTCRRQPKVASQKTGASRTWSSKTGTTSRGVPNLIRSSFIHSYTYISLVVALLTH